MIYNEQPDDFTPDLEVVGCLIEHKGKILLLQTCDHKVQGDRWGTPGGKIDKEDISIKKAIQREIKEETGLFLLEDSLNLYKRYFVEHLGKKFIYHNFHSHLESIPEITITEKEHKAFTWVTVEEALQMPLILDEDHCLKDYYGIK